MSLFSLLLCSVFWGTPYIIYGREKDFLLSVFRTVSFLKSSMFFVPFPIFQICYIMVFAMRTGFPFLLSWYKRKGNEKKKSRLRLRAYSGKAAHAPTPRPTFFFTPRRFAVGFGFSLTLNFGFYYLALYTFMLTMWNTYQYRIEKSAFPHGILYT